MSKIKGIHFEKEIVELCTRWYVEKKLSCRKLEAILKERGLTVDHATINRWIKKFKDQFASTEATEAEPDNRWSMQESYVKIRGQWRYLCLFTDNQDKLIDFYVSDESDRLGALKFYLDHNHGHLALQMEPTPVELTC